MKSLLGAASMVGLVMIAAFFGYRTLCDNAVTLVNPTRQAIQVAARIQGEDHAFSEITLPPAGRKTLHFVAHGDPVLMLEIKSKDLKTTSVPVDAYFTNDSGIRCEVWVTTNSCKMIK